SDTGPGIEPAALARIFEPFFTTRLTGNGLGLATIRDIVREHDGAINVQSTVGIGSRFEVWLPRLDGAAGQSSPAIIFGDGEIVMVVESDPDGLLRDEEVLAALGYDPVGFACAADAEAACRISPERFDLIVLGHLAPAEALLTLSAKLHALASHLPILLATTSANEFGASVLIAAGISDVVPWPIAAA